MKSALWILLLLAGASMAYAGGGKEAPSDPANAAMKPTAKPASKANTIVVIKSGNGNSAGATTGTVTAGGVTVPMVTGGKGYAPIPNGVYPGVVTNVPTSQSANPMLRDEYHQSLSKTYMPIPGTGGAAIHQGHIRATQEAAWTEGCVGITGTAGGLNAQKNYALLSSAVSPVVTVVVQGSDYRGADKGR